MTDPTFLYKAEAQELRDKTLAERGNYHSFRAFSPRLENNPSIKLHVYRSDSCEAHVYDMIKRAAEQADGYNAPVTASFNDIEFIVPPKTNSWDLFNIEQFVHQGGDHIEATELKNGEVIVQRFGTETIRNEHLSRYKAHFAKESAAIDPNQILMATQTIDTLPLRSPNITFTNGEKAPLNFDTIRRLENIRDHIGRFNAPHITPTFTISPFGSAILVGLDDNRERKAEVPVSSGITGATHDARVLDEPALKGAHQI